MKDRVDKLIGIVTLIAEALAKINPTEPLRFDFFSQRYPFLG